MYISLRHIITRDTFNFHSGAKVVPENSPTTKVDLLKFLFHYENLLARKNARMRTHIHNIHTQTHTLY